MKILKQILTSKKFFVTACVLLVLILAVFALEKTHKIHIFESDTSTQKRQAAQSDHDKKAAVVENNGNQVNDSNDSKGATNSTYTPPTNSDGVSITASQSGSQVTVTTKLVNYSDGACTLTVTNGTRTTSQSAQVIYAPDFSTCAGFSVPVNTLGSGVWNISLSVVSGGVVTGKSITFEVQ